MPCRLLADDRDGIPNVLVEAMAAGTPVVATRRVGHPRARRARRQRPARRARRPRGAGRRAAAAARRPRARRAARRRAARDDRRAALRRRPRLARQLAGLFEEALARDAPIARRPRPVLCVTEHEHRDRDVADGVRAGRFTRRGRDARARHRARLARRATARPTRSGGSSGSSSPGGSTSRTPPPRPATPRYRDAWERLVGSWIAQVPPDHDAAEVTARRILNWIYAWQAFAAGAPSTPARLLAQHRRPGPRTSATNLAPERNHRTLELYALLVAALALPELDRDGGCSTSPSPSSTATSRRTSAPTASTARPRRTTT